MRLFLFLLITGVLIWAVVIFNRLVRRRNTVRNAWADIDVQLTRRHDLVPQLVAAVRGYVTHERTVLEAVTELRGRALQPRGVAAQGEAEGALEGALSRLLLLREAYPELAASENFVQLHRELITIEEHLQFARRYYNGAVRDHNNAVQRFPDLLVARLTGFRDAEFYQADAGERALPAVELTP